MVFLIKQLDIEAFRQMEKKIELIIDDNATLQAVQQLFNDFFPFLRINFFSYSKEISGDRNRKLLDKCLKKLAEFRLTKASITIIHPEMSVQELEEKMKSDFGLETQIYRCSGRIWLETNETDSWSLKEQNDQGEALS